MIVNSLVIYNLNIVYMTNKFKHIPTANINYLHLSIFVNINKTKDFL